MMTATRREQVLDLVEQKGVLRPRDLEEHGIARQYLRLLQEEGRLERIGRGLYVLADADASEHRTLAEASRRVPHGIICLLSALRFHDFTSQSPFLVWMAIQERARKPWVDYPPMRFVRFSGEAWEYGVEEHRIDGVKVRVYSSAKTVADCFKHRSKIGLEVALEALRGAWAQRRATMDELWRAARVCRMQNVMKPYLESLT